MRPSIALPKLRFCIRCRVRSAHSSSALFQATCSSASCWSLELRARTPNLIYPSAQRLQNYSDPCATLLYLGPQTVKVAGAWIGGIVSAASQAENCRSDLAKLARQLLLQPTVKMLASFGLQFKTTCSRCFFLCPLSNRRAVCRFVLSPPYCAWPPAYTSGHAHIECPNPSKVLARLAG